MNYKPAVLVDALKDSLEKKQFLRLTLSKLRKGIEAANKIQIRLVDIKGKPHLSFLYKYPTQDITKNFLLPDGLEEIEGLFNGIYLIANLFTSEELLSIETKKKGKIMLKVQANKNSDELPSRLHDHQKKEWIQDKRFLVKLGILGDKGQVRKSMGDKYRQIKKFVEIIDAQAKQVPSLADKASLNIVDMGAGKGYLTFAVYDYFKHSLERDVKVRGIEIRDNLIDQCNGYATELGFKNLSFEKGFIQDFELEDVDILMALHACDTATDDAIYKGIKAEADLIICAPCCHKQVRQSIASPKEGIPIFGHGILKERQAEILTDTIRALLLEQHGYRTKIFEFISTEHTGKNLMIVGQKHAQTVDQQQYQMEIDRLKSSFGIQEHYLENLLSQ